MLIRTLFVASIVFATSCAVPVEALPSLDHERKEQSPCSNNDCKRQSDSDGGDIEGELIELVDIVLEITEQALGSNYSGTGSGTFVGGNFLSPTIVIDPNYGP
ncbi:hypothetical protein PG985_007095 [Apiospora marii]|uniref:uncharacterized protein n=1 Tax=Apiospora marii TaxID=335849 RepID=UPI00312E0309